MTKIPSAVIGATGMVGQRIIAMLENHPQFTLHEIVSSKRTAGKNYTDTVVWNLPTPLPQNVRNLVLKEAGSSLTSPVIFSGMPTGPAKEIELYYATNGHFVISNSSSHRMDPLVPLVIPEVNANHLSLVKNQPTTGAIVTNCNCTTMFLTMVLAPLHRHYGIDSVTVSTMQAVSGAGYPGVASIDILGNTFPLPLEEEKIESETLKILGSLSVTGVDPASFPISAQCQRVPVAHGHTETITIALKTEPDLSELTNTLSNFRGVPQDLDLHSAPISPIVVFEQNDRPQPLLDIDLGAGMVTAVGRIRRCPVSSVKMLVMGNNLIRGAAGAAVLNAETLLAMDLLTI